MVLKLMYPVLPLVIEIAEPWLATFDALPLLVTENVLCFALLITAPEVPLIAMSKDEALVKNKPPSFQ